MVNAHIRDAFAVCEWAAFMEDQIQVQGLNSAWTEISAAEHLSSLRRAQPLNRGDSFTTISASGSNAAIIHYSPTPETDAAVNDTAIFMGAYLLIKYTLNILLYA